ncbi:hypothetical protein K402DRAFT_405137 [Aulographum hederae CBS 113979]|uniref:Uncharacterized protein n=1 Tax=Aulographum hederae CBS 113979 TaxID=1176131 RepID=A0A6G1GY80_9PEZI|nr:hypothetical protein K402DRAFT_405137 [Aulographum hederae CBS 113979]
MDTFSTKEDVRPLVVPLKTKLYYTKYALDHCIQDMVAATESTSVACNASSSPSHRPLHPILEETYLGRPPPSNFTSLPLNDAILNTYDSALINCTADLVVERIFPSGCHDAGLSSQDSPPPSQTPGLRRRHLLLRRDNKPAPLTDAERKISECKTNFEGKRRQTADCMKQPYDSLPGLTNLTDRRVVPVKESDEFVFVVRELGQCRVELSEMAYALKDCREASAEVDAVVSYGRKKRSVEEPGMAEWVNGQPLCNGTFDFLLDYPTSGFRDMNRTDPRVVIPMITLVLLFLYILLRASREKAPLRERIPQYQRKEAGRNNVGDLEKA